MFSLPSGVLSRDDDDLVRGRVGSLYRGENRCTLLALLPTRARFVESVAVTDIRRSPGGLGPGASALVGHGHKVVQTRASDRVQEVLTFHASKGKSLSPD
jgi:hypothetical protein